MLVSDMNVRVHYIQFFKKEMDDRTMYYGLITLGALVRFSDCVPVCFGCSSVELN
jgi:hypothetical protein